MVRVFIADDSIGFGALAATWLAGFDDLEVVGTVRSAEEAVGQIQAAAPDVLLLDRLLPHAEHSEQVLEHVRRVLPATRVVLLSGMPDAQLAREAARLGTEGHVSKAIDAAGLAAAIRAAAG